MRPDPDDVEPLPPGPHEGPDEEHRDLLPRLEPGAVLTQEEWDEYFGDPEGDDVVLPRSEPLRRIIAALAVIALVATGAFTAWLTVIRDRNRISDPVEIVAEARQVVATSPWGWLVTDVVVGPIEEPDIGGFVASRPPDGVVHLDARSWRPDGLRQTVVHEIGHLLDFALAAPGAELEAEPRAGLEAEVWAECTAVLGAERSVDGDGETDEYRCTREELTSYTAALDGVTEVCRFWSTPECRPAP